MENKFCPERIEDLMEEKPGYAETIKESVAQIADIAECPGFKRLIDHVSYRNEEDYKLLKAIDKTDDKFGLRAAILLAVAQEREFFISYIKDMLVESRGDA